MPDILTYLLIALASSALTLLGSTTRMAHGFAKAHSKLLAEEVHRAAKDMTPESVMQGNRDLIEQRGKYIERCESHIEDLTHAYASNNTERINELRDKIMAELGESQTVKPTFVPNDMICEAHALVHAPEYIVGQLNAMHVEHVMRGGRSHT